MGHHWSKMIEGQPKDGEILKDVEVEQQGSEVDEVHGLEIVDSLVLGESPVVFIHSWRNEGRTEQVRIRRGLEHHDVDISSMKGQKTE